MVVRLGIASLWILAVIGCTSPKTPIAPPTEVAQLRIQVRGCAVYYLDRACRLPKDRTLQFWLNAPVGGGSTVTHDLGPTVKPVENEGGLLYEAVIPEGRDGVHFESGGARWALELRPPAAPGWLPAVETEMKAKRYEAALGLLAPVLEKATGEERGIALAHQCRIEGRMGNRKAMIAGLQRSRAENLRLGRVSQVLKDSSALVYMLSRNGHRLAEAREVLATVPDFADAYEPYASFHHASAQLFIHTGDFRTALRSSTRVAEASLRFRDERMYFNAQIARSNTLVMLGQFVLGETVLQTLMKTSPKAADPCNRAYLLTDIGWGRIIQLESGAKDVVNPLPLFAEAAEIARTTCKLGYTNNEANNRINIALAALHAGDVERAKSEAIHLSKLDPEADAFLYGWARDVSARIAFAEGRHADALTIFGDLGTWAVGHANPRLLWRSTLGRAEALQASGRSEAALLAYGEADAMARTSVMAIGLGQGRATFVASRKRANALRVNLLLSLGRNGEAERAVRGYRREALLSTWRTRRIGTLDTETRRQWSGLLGRYQQGRADLEKVTRAAWRLPTDQRNTAAAANAAAEAKLRDLLDQAYALVSAPSARVDLFRAPDPGELVVTYFRGNGADHVFVRKGAAVRVVKLSPWALGDSPARLASSLLSPLVADLVDQVKIRLLVSGDFAKVDFHALPHEGRPLIAKHEVVYSVDLPPEAVKPAAEGGIHLVVTDPRSNLPVSRREGATIESALGGRNQRTVSLAGPSAVASRVLSRLGAVDHFHFSGHAVFGGREGVDSRLQLADDTSLGVVDILALERVPRTVALLGCETGKTERAPVPSFSLANAFLISGSQQVVAATRPIRDTTAGFVSGRLYSATGQLQLRRAQQDALAAGGFDDWPHLRRFVR